MLPETTPRTWLGRARAAALGAVARIRSPLFWRLLYWLLARDATVAGAASLVRAANRVRAGAGSVALARFSSLVVQSGWPNQSPGWVNLDTARFFTRVSLNVKDQPRSRVPPRPPLPLQGRHLRLGLVGEFGRPLIFSAEHFAELPDDVETHVFDIAHAGRDATYLEPLVVSYCAFPRIRGDRAAAEALARAINKARLDLLVFMSGPGNAYELMDVIDTPCIGFVTFTSSLIFHERVGFQIYCQPEPDYFFRDHELFCGLSKAPFREPRAVPGFLLLGSRGFQQSAPRRAWLDRDPLMVFHGSLYKANSPAYLRILFEFMRADDSLELVFMGRDDGGALSAILSAAARGGLKARVHYEGAFSLVRSPSGSEVADAGWRRLEDLLGRARLAPDPWPVGGAGARVEAYLAGAPTAHMAVRFEQESWGKRQHAVLEIPALLIDEASATTIAGYAEICRRCLYDGPFADAVIASQLVTVEKVLDASAYWRQLTDAYQAWRQAQRPV